MSADPKYHFQRVEGAVIGFAVADGHCAVCIQEHHGHGLSENGAPAYHNGVLTGERNVVGFS